MNFIKRWLLPTKFKFEDKILVQQAFILDGVVYYQCATALDLPVGRGLTANIHYEEFRMKVDKEYLDLHIAATEVLLKGTDGKITMDHLLTLKQINYNLKERASLVAMPDHVYKLASIYFWDETESPYRYDPAYNEEKIAKWKKNPEVLSFFLTGPLKEFMPSFESESLNAETYLTMADRIGDEQRKLLHRVLSRVK